MWRTEVAGADQLMRCMHVLHIGLGGVEEALDMVVGMIPYLMSSALDLGEELGVATDIVRYAEEGSLHPQLIELIQYPRGYLGYRTIIERKIDTLPRDRWDTPSRSWDEHAVPHRYTTQKSLDHLVYIISAKANYCPPPRARTSCSI